MAVTLVEHFKLSKDPLHKAFISDLLRASDLMSIVPFETIPGLQVSGTRWKSLPSVAFRKIGNGYTEGTGTTEPVVETLSVLGGDVKIDRILDNSGNMWQDPLELQMRMKAQAMAYTFNESFVNGDQADNEDEFEGVVKRLSNMPARMTIFGDASEDGTGDALNILASTANENTFLDYLHRLIKYVSPTHLLMNEDSVLGFEQAFRRVGLMSDTQDQFDRTVSSFRGVPIIDVGILGDKTTEIITNTEDPGNGSADATSIYAVRMDTTDGLHGIVTTGKEMPTPYDPLNGAELESGPQILRRIDWPVGLWNLSEYSLGVIRGVRFAAS
jgi:hypothetical protein